MADDIGNMMRAELDRLADRLCEENPAWCFRIAGHAHHLAPGETRGHFDRDNPWPFSDGPPKAT